MSRGALYWLAYWRDSLLETDVKRNALGFAWLLTRWANNDTGLVLKTQEELADAYGATVRTVQRHIEELERVGALEIIEHRTSRGERWNSYRLIMLDHTTVLSGGEISDTTDLSGGNKNPVNSDTTDLSGGPKIAQPTRQKVQTHTTNLVNPHDSSVVYNYESNYENKLKGISNAEASDVFPANGQVTETTNELVAVFHAEQATTGNPVTKTSDAEYDRWHRQVAHRARALTKSGMTTGEACRHVIDVYRRLLDTWKYDGVPAPGEIFGSEDDPNRFFVYEEEFLYFAKTGKPGAVPEIGNPSAWGNPDPFTMPNSKESFDDDVLEQSEVRPADAIEQPTPEQVTARYKDLSAQHPELKTKASRSQIMPLIRAGETDRAILKKYGIHTPDLAAQAS